MEAYKFKTTIQENGIIKIPEMSRWAQQHVEVFIVIDPADKPQSEAKLPLTTFLERWQGFLKGYDPDELRAQYLQEKYG